MRLAPFHRLVLGLGLLAAACSEPAGDEVGGAGAGQVDIVNTGGPLEGHTPRGFAGSGTGLFVGDNLNPNFPDGDGVQLFVAFELPDERPASFETAVLTSDVLSVSGTPFEDLGALLAERVAFDEFGPAVFDTPAVGEAVECSVIASRVSCDVSESLTTAVTDGRRHLQFRLRFETPGDGDGSQDLAMFFATDSNTNEPGLFALRLTY